MQDLPYNPINPSMDPITQANFRYWLTQLGGAGAQGRSHNPKLSSFNSNGDKALQFQTNDFAQGLNWDAPNYQFILQTDGIYLVGVCVKFDPGTDSTVGSTYASVYQNGSAIAYMYIPQELGFKNSAQCLTLVKGVSGDKFTFYCGSTYAASANPVSISNSTTETYCFISKT